MAPKRKTTNALRQVRTEAYRTVIRRAAERVIAEHGFMDASVQQIAAAAGMSIGTVYRAYAGKKAEIYREIQVHHGTEVVGRARAVGLAVWQRGGDVLDAMLAGIGAYVEYFLEHPDFLRIVLREEKAWAQGPPRKTVAQTTMWNEGMGGMEESIRQGIAAGLFIDQPSNVMARTLAAIQQAHLACWLEAGCHERPAEVIGRLRRQLVHAVCRPEILAERLAHLADLSESPADTEGQHQ